jgi:lipid-binding SYLF domain-containing protein
MALKRVTVKIVVRWRCMAGVWDGESMSGSAIMGTREAVRRAFESETARRVVQAAVGSSADLVVA